MTWFAVGLGAALGAWLRWGLAIWLNGSQAALPWGTLVSNLCGGFLIGLAAAYLADQPGLPVEWRLFAVTGFLGALTTFSTFSLESVLLLQRGDFLGALGHTAIHVIGSLALCAAGFAVYRALN